MRRRTISDFVTFITCYNGICWLCAQLTPMKVFTVSCGGGRIKQAVVKNNLIFFWSIRDYRVGLAGPGAWTVPDHWNGCYYYSGNEMLR